MALSEDTIRKRLSGLNTSQDSIQTASLWIMHYKESADKVAKCWMDVYKEADDHLRTALIYVMNDVVQKVGKKDGGDTVKFAFHPHVVNACGLASDAVKKAISKCVAVFADRHVFPSHIIEEMRAALGSPTKRPRKESKELEESFSEIYASMVREIESYSQNEEITEKARNILERSNFNFKEKMQERMKDRAEGTKILSELDESKNKLVQFLNSVERHQKKCKRLAEMLKGAKSSFNLQLRDVTIVDDAYEKFEIGILETRKQLKATIDSGALVAKSPPRDAPSPLPTDDPFNEEGGSGDDMEMDDDEDESIARPPASTPNTSLITVKDYATTAVPQIPATSALDPRLQRLLNQNQRTVGGGAALNPNEQREINSAMSGAAAHNFPSTAAPSPVVVSDPRQRSTRVSYDSPQADRGRPSPSNHQAPPFGYLVNGPLMSHLPPPHMLPPPPAAANRMAAPPNFMDFSGPPPGYFPSPSSQPVTPLRQPSAAANHGNNSYNNGTYNNNGSNFNLNNSFPKRTTKRKFPSRS